MSQKFKSDIETQAGLIDSFGFTGTAGQVLSSTGTKTEWITPPQSPGGGGSSQVFYFNGGTASSVGGYYQMSPVANTGTGADFTINANGYIASFLTDVASPNQLNIPAGNWNFEIYFSASSSGGSPSFYVELYKYSSGGVFTLIASSSATPEGITNGTAIDAYFTPLAVPATTLLVTDRLAVRVYVTHSGRTITMHTQNGHLSEVITTFSTGLTALNGLTAQVQYFTVGTAGTDFNISSATNTHTFNLPTASATNRGALSSADWTTFNSKANASGTVNYVSKFTGATTLGNSQIFDNGINVGIGTTSPAYKLQVVNSGNTLLQLNGNNTAGTIDTGFTISADDSKNIYLYQRENASTVFGTNNAERMRITSSGNIGIGTSSPSYTFDLNSNAGNISFKTYTSTTNYSEHTYSKSAGFFIDSYQSVSGAPYTKTTDLIANADAGADSQLRLFTATTGENPIERMRITNAGNVGIGTTTPGTKLQINVAPTGTQDDGMRVTDGTRIIQTNIVGNTYNYRSVGPNETMLYSTGNPLNIVSDGQPIKFTAGTSEKMRIDSSGNVGIGATSPSEKLDVYGVIRGVYTADPGAVGAVTAKLLSYSPSPYGIVFRGYSSGAHSIQVQRESNVAQVYPLGLQPLGGSVGIGTITPSQLLHVAGNARVTGSIYDSTNSPGASGQVLSSTGTGTAWTTGGGGGSQNLQQVTDVGNSTTNIIYFNGNVPIYGINNSVFLGSENLPNGTSYASALEETSVGVYDNITGVFETGVYAKRNIYCGAYNTTTILTIAEPNSSVDLVAKIGYGSRFFIAKVSVIVDWGALTYTYKITSTNTTNYDDSDSLNINFEFAFSGAEFGVQINNNSGNDIYPNINANIL